MNEIIDLADIADDLTTEFPSIKGLYLFGSRAFGTGSPRSDIDILVEYDEHIRPADLREFIENKCKCDALDLFLIDESNKAVSTQNESYVQSDSLDNLITKLSAKKFWEKGTGRLQLDIPWKQNVRVDMKFIPSILPMRKKSNEKNNFNPEKLTIGEITKALTPKQMFAIVSILLSIFGGGYWFGSHIIIMKDNKEIHQSNSKNIKIETIKDNKIKIPTIIKTKENNSTIAET